MSILDFFKIFKAALSWPLPPSIMIRSGSGQISFLFLIKMFSVSEFLDFFGNWKLLARQSFSVGGVIGN